MNPSVTQDEEHISNTIELSHQKYLVKVCMIVGLPVLGFFIIYDILKGRYFVSFNLFLMFSIIMSLFLMIRKPDYRAKENIIYQYFLTALFILFGFYLIYTIGVEGNFSKMPWAFMYPVLVFFALGVVRALIWVSILYIALLCLGFFFFPNENLLIEDLKPRFYIAFLSVIIASYFFERLRRGYQLELINNQITLEESESRYRAAYEKLSNEMKERIRAEEALRESEEVYRALVEDMPALICRFLPDGTLSFVNSSYCRYFDKTRKELVGENFFQFIPEPERKKVRTHFESLTFENPVVSYEHQVFAPDREVRWQRWTDRALFDEKGKLYQYQSVGIDITESKKAENALLQSEARFRELAELMPETIYEMDLTGNLTFVNRKAYDHFRYTQEDFDNGLNGFDMITPEDRDRAIQNVQRILNGESIGLNEYTALRKDGGTFPIMIHSAAIIREGELVGIRGFIIDLTDRKRAEEERIKLEAQFQQAQRLETIGTLAGGIAHDFNNLLMSIQGNTSLMLFDIDSTQSNYELLKNIEKQIEKGAKLTKQLLGYARKGKYNVTPINLNQIVKESSVTFGRTRREITIHSELANELYSIEADQGQIEQILYNLYVNAADAMPGGGELFLKTSNVIHEDIKSEQYDPAPGYYVRLTITDTGIGIDETVKERIFEPFFTTKETGQGTGLGLASVYGITKSHDGYIEVDSEKGNGCIFNIYLPASEKKPLDPPETATHIIEGSGTILLVDDEEMVLDVGVKVLKKMGYTALEAKSGREAVDIFKENKEKIDLVILDMIMPEVGGGEAYDRIKAINPRIKVLLSSGYSIDGQATEIMKRGCDGFIQKPFKANELSGKLKEILGMKRS
jgi:PAS domain S-box-containing protein